MGFSLTSAKSINIISLSGNLLSEAQSKEILDKVDERIENGEVNFVVDMAEVKFMNSSALGMILTCLTKARKAGGELVLSNIPEQVQNLLLITKLTEIFAVSDSVEDAINNHF